MGHSHLIEIDSQTDTVALTTDEAATTQKTTNASSQREKTNPFLLAATTLLTLMTHLKKSNQPQCVEDLHRRVAGEVQTFLNKLSTLKYPRIMIDSACYCLCAAMDEAIFATHWGTQSLWAQNSLLSLFKGDTWGGERFYIIAETLSREPRKYIYVLELIYILLSLGFEGRYYGQQRVMRDEVRNRLFQQIRGSRGKIEKSLSINWRDDIPLTVRQQKRYLLNKLLIISSGILFVLFAYYNVLAYRYNDPLRQQIQNLGRESAVTAYSQLLKRPIFPHSFK